MQTQWLAVTATKTINITKSHRISKTNNFAQTSNFTVLRLARSEYMAAIFWLNLTLHTTTILLLAYIVSFVVELLQIQKFRTESWKYGILSFGFPRWTNGRAFWWNIMTLTFQYMTKTEIQSRKLKIWNFEFWLPRTNGRTDGWTDIRTDKRTDILSKYNDPNPPVPDGTLR